MEEVGAYLRRGTGEAAGAAAAAAQGKWSVLGLGSPLAPFAEEGWSQPIAKAIEVEERKGMRGLRGISGNQPGGSKQPRTGCTCQGGGCRCHLADPRAA